MVTNKYRIVVNKTVSPDIATRYTMVKQISGLPYFWAGSKIT